MGQLAQLALSFNHFQHVGFFVPCLSTQILIPPLQQSTSGFWDLLQVSRAEYPFAPQTASPTPWKASFSLSLSLTSSRRHKYLEEFGKTYSRHVVQESNMPINSGSPTSQGSDVKPGGMGMDVPGSPTRVSPLPVSCAY